MTHLHGNLQLCTKFEENVTNNLEDMSRTGLQTDGRTDGRTDLVVEPACGKLVVEPACGKLDIAVTTGG